MNTPARVASAPAKDSRIIVVGAGPAGLGAATRAAELGASVTLIDEAARPGGQIYRQPPQSMNLKLLIGTPGELARKQRVLERFERVRERIDYRPDTAAIAYYPGHQVLVADQNCSELLKASAVIVATGLSELTVPFPGWTLPGITTAGALQALLKSDGLRAGERVVLAGTGPLLVAVAAQLVRAGAEVLAVALLHPFFHLFRNPALAWKGREAVADGLRYLTILKRAGVPILDGWIPVCASGDCEVRNLVLARRDSQGRPVPGTDRHFAVDSVGLNYGFNANSELLRMAGADVVFDGLRGGWLARREENGSTSVPGMFVAGDSAGLRGALAASADGSVVGAAAAGWILHQNVSHFSALTAKDAKERSRHWRFQDALAQLFSLPPGVWSWARPDTVICRCESVQRERIDRAFDDGHLSLNGVKRNCRAAMGFCGGRNCLRTVAALVGERSVPRENTLPVAVNERGTKVLAMQARPGIRLATLAALANRVGDEP
ncbi:MAG: FAD-dependent oxidoreductase [Rhodoferax sp.]